MADNDATVEWNRIFKELNLNIEKINQSVDRMSGSSDSATSTGNQIVVYPYDNQLDVQADLLSKEVSSIVTGLDKLIKAVSALEPSLFEQFLTVVGSAIAGAVAAFLFTLLHRKADQKKQIGNRLALQLSEIFKAMKSDSIEYWSNDSVSSTMKKQKELRAKIITNQTLAVALIGKLCCSEKKLIQDVSTKKEIMEGNLKGYAVATSDDFGSDNQLASQSKVNQVSQIYSRVISDLTSI